MVQDVLHELALTSHSGGELTSDLLNGTPEDWRVVEVGLVEAVLVELVGLRFQDFREALDLGAEFVDPARRG